MPFLVNRYCDGVLCTTGPLRGETRSTDEELFRAVRLGDLTALKGIVEQSPGLVNRRFRSGSSPLSYAVFANQTDVVKFLLEHEADPNQPIGNDGETAIFNAVSAETVALLVKYGAEVSLETKRYEVTPIRAAARRGDTEAVRALMRAGARLDFASAVMLGWTDKAAEMLKKQPRLAATPSAMLWASVSHNRVDVWRLLLTCGADPNEDFDVANVGGPHTPVTCVVSRGDFAATKLLLEHGGDPNVCGGAITPNCCCMQRRTLMFVFCARCWHEEPIPIRVMISTETSPPFTWQRVWEDHVSHSDMQRRGDSHQRCPPTATTPSIEPRS